MNQCFDREVLARSQGSQQSLTFALFATTTLIVSVSISVSLASRNLPLESLTVIPLHAPVTSVKVAVVVLQHIVVPRKSPVTPRERTAMWFFSGVLAHVALEMLWTLETLLAKLAGMLML